MKKDSNDPAGAVTPSEDQAVSVDPAGAEESGAKADTAVFDDLSTLRKRQDFDNLTATQRLRTRVPVGRPGKQTWFRVHPDPGWALPGHTLEWEEDGTTFFVLPDVAAELEHDLKRVMLRTVVTPQATPSLWPIRMPNADGTDNSWFVSARDAAQRAEVNWIRIVANREASAYEVHLATADYGEPNWPAEGFRSLLKIAFAGKVIETIDDPVVRRLLGRSS
jgi:hypothetical protein